MADNGLSMSSLRTARSFPTLGLSLSFLLIYEGVTESNTASQIEQRKENVIERRKNIMSADMMWAAILTI